MGIEELSHGDVRVVNWLSAERLVGCQTVLFVGAA